MNVPKRTEIDSDLYQRVNDANNSEYDKDIAKLQKINYNYYQAVNKNIKSNAKRISLYATTALSDEQKYVRMHEQIKYWIGELNDMVKDVDVEQDHSLTPSTFYKENDEKMTGLYAKVFQVDSAYETREKLEDELSKTYNKESLKNAEIIAEKRIPDFYNNESFKQYLVEQNKLNKSRLSNAKRTLANYTIKWIWYVAALAILLIGLILCIVLPVVL